MDTATATGQAPNTASESHEHRELLFAILAGIAYFNGLILEYLVKADAAAWLAFLATYFFGGFYTIQEVIASIRRRRFEVDFLMIVAAIGAASIGRWAEGAVLLFLFSLGHALEEVAMAKARASIEALAAMMPRVARVRRDQAVVEVPVDDLVPGDVCVVRGDDRIPADGIVIAGSTAVDQSSVTGESIPVDKVPVTDRARAEQAPDTVGPESTVFSGTVNGSGAIDVLVTRRAEDSTLARLVQLVREAESSKSPTQRFLDRFQRWYIPAVLLLVVTVFLVGAFVLDRGVSPSFYLAMVVLVAGSPCALAIATPSAILAGVARAARAGVLVKGGGPLENLGRIQVAYFDKTGTLTWGRPRVTDIRTAPGVDEAELRRTAYAVERLSGHPLAAAVVRDLRPEDADRLPEATDVESVTGLGVRARFEGQDVQVGSPRMWSELPPAIGAEVDPLQAEGRTIMVVGTGERILGVVGLMDPPRAESAPMVNSQRAAGIGQIVMLSGDHQQVAAAVGRDVGADEVRGGLMPEDKVGAVATVTGAGTRSAMIGDGVNDAPAMANSTVGIAMGAAGSPVALETAEVALMSDDIGRLPFIVRLSRQTSRIIRINLLFSLVVVIGLVTLSLLGLGIGPAVLVHEGSTIVVVLIALTLLRFQVGREHEGIEHDTEPAPTR